MSLDMIKHYPVMLNEVLSFISDNKTNSRLHIWWRRLLIKYIKKFKKSNVIGLDRDKNILEYALKLKQITLRGLVFTILNFLKYIILNISKFRFFYI